MHRMTDYITDLHNMIIGFVCLLSMGALIFLPLRQIQKRNSMHGRMIMANHLEVIYKPFGFKTRYEFVLVPPIIDN